MNKYFPHLFSPLTVGRIHLKNHIAMYTHSVAPGVTDSLMMMNGKRMPFSQNSIAGTPIIAEKSNLHYQNGMLFVVGKEIDYMPNIFEYLRKDPELDSLRSFMYNCDIEVVIRLLPLPLCFHRCVDR